MERTRMHRQELERAQVLARVAARDMTLGEAARLLAVSYRQAKRLWGRYRTGGPTALVHGHVGRPSSHQAAGGERAAVLALVRAHYGGATAKGPGQRFGPTLCAEHLWAEHGLLVPVSTLRGWMTAAGLWSRVRRARPAHVRRERKRHFGELVQLDGSFHDWYEGRGPYAGRRSCLMSLVDDATGTTLLQFGAEETTWAAAALLEAWIARYGVPRALYTDWKNVYLRPATSAEQSRGEAGRTQVGRMCAKLGIQVIGASSPQAKGRVERGHGTHQDRLIKKLRRLEIADDAAANVYLAATYLPQHNGWFAIAAASPVDYHRAWPPGLAPAAVWCLEESRVVGNDYVVRYAHRQLQLDRKARGRVAAKSTVLVREGRDGALQVVHVARDGTETVCRWTPVSAPAPVHAAVHAPVPPAVSRPRPQPPVPRPEHPWRRAFARDAAVAQARKAARLAERSARRAALGHPSQGAVSHTRNP